MEETVDSADDDDDDIAAAVISFNYSRNGFARSTHSDRRYCFGKFCDKASDNVIGP